jgi:hypothetical protein
VPSAAFSQELKTWKQENDASSSPHRSLPTVTPHSKRTEYREYSPTVYSTKVLWASGHMRTNANPSTYSSIALIRVQDTDLKTGYLCCSGRLEVTINQKTTL